MAETKSFVFTDYSFDKLLKQFQDRVKLKATWKDTYRSSTGQMLIELFSYLGELVLYYIERRAEESYLDTAKLKSSVMNIVRILNYKPKRKVSSKGVVRFVLDNPHDKKIFIPKFTEAETQDGTKFLTVKDAIIVPGQLEIDVEAIQGSLVETTRSATGLAYQEYHIDDVDVEEDNLWIYIDGEEWTAVDSFILSENTSKHYRIRPELDDTLTVVFGDGVRGKTPPNGAEILIRYIKTAGKEGNVYETGKIVKLNSLIFDEDEKLVQDISVTNSSLFLGGDDAESIEEIKYYAPKVFKTGDRAVHKEDFQVLLQSYPGVASSNVWGENEEGSPNYNMFNTIRISMVLQDWQLPTETFQNEVVDYLTGKSLLTVRYEFILPEIIEVEPTLDVKVKKGYSFGLMQDAIESALVSLFELGRTTKLGISKRYSDIVSVIDGLDGVDYHYLELRIRKELTSAGSDWVATLEAVPVRPRYLELYVGSNLIGTDDGEGNWVAKSTYTLSGNIDYLSGELSVNIDPAPVDTVCVKYLQDKKGDIEIGKNQICKLYGVKIVSMEYSN